MKTGIFPQTTAMDDDCQDMAYLYKLCNGELSQ